MFNYCATIAQELRLETLKNKGKCLATLHGNYCVAFRELLRNYCISSRDPFYSDPNTPPIKEKKCENNRAAFC